jgi:hypothetical protein
MTSIQHVMSGLMKNATRDAVAYLRMVRLWMNLLLTSADKLLVKLFDRS